MELVAENGCIVPIPKGCKKELGRGSELAIHDKTVSRHQILLDLQEQNQEAHSVDRDTHFGLSVKVLGANPVCIVHVEQSIGSRSKGQEMVMLRKGEMDMLLPGDKISLSLKVPMFLTVRDGEARKNTAGSKTQERAGSSVVVPMKEDMPMNAECSKPMAEDDLLGKWKNRKKEQKSGVCIAQDMERAEASENRRVLADEDAATNEEEEGIAQAVARRQKRAFDRRQQQEQNLRDKHTVPMQELEHVPKAERESKLEDIVVNTENIDPVKEFGFLVEGSEFEQYKKRHKPDGGRWVWPPAVKSSVESGSDEDDEDQQEKHRQSRKGKKRVDEEWKGDDQEEKVAIASTKRRKGGSKVNLRSQEPSSSKKRDTATKKAVISSASKDRREETEDEGEDEDEADETLGGFIVDDNEEDDLPDEDEDDEEDEASDDEDIDEDMEEEDEEDVQRNGRKKKREEKPLCKYGKNCYRKNRDHLAQYQH